MTSKLEQILTRCLNGRRIAVWGTPTRALLRELIPYSWESADRIDPRTHYVIPVTQSDCDDFLADAQSENYEDVSDFITYDDPGKELPFEWELYGTKVGKYTYFGSKVANACQNGYIDRIGNYTSINATAAIHVDHQSDMIFLSDELPRCFQEEHRTLFHQKCLDSPKHPYNLSKNRLIIGNDVWIGTNAFIDCSKVSSIGDGAIIGAGAVVLQDVPPYAVVVGVPAKVIRYRFSPDQIETLLNVKWWNWDEKTIQKNADALINPDLFEQRWGQRAKKSDISPSI